LKYVRQQSTLEVAASTTIFEHFRLVNSRGTKPLLYTLSNIDLELIGGLSARSAICKFLKNKLQEFANLAAPPIGDSYVKMRDFEFTHKIDDNRTILCCVSDARSLFNVPEGMTLDEFSNQLDRFASRLPLQKDGTRRLYHGTTILSATSIVIEGIKRSELEESSDFGAAFYTTEDLSYALYYAIFSQTANDPALVVFDIPNDHFLDWHTLDLDTDVLNWEAQVIKSRNNRSPIVGYDTVTGPITSNATKIECGAKPLRLSANQIAFLPSPAGMFVVPTTDTDIFVYRICNMFLLESRSNFI
jgi:hypothetical protein